MDAPVAQQPRMLKSGASDVLVPPTFSAPTHEDEVLEKPKASDPIMMPDEVGRHSRRQYDSDSGKGPQGHDVACRTDTLDVLGVAADTREVPTTHPYRVATDTEEVPTILRAPYTRPKHEMVPCEHCGEKFRGQHELHRHEQRMHSRLRQGFICFDSSPDQKFLSTCKHCRNKKVYGAYYNAAAHLRRYPFHPKQRGRKDRQEKRPGTGGGNDPPMDVLKANWIREVTIPDKDGERTRVQLEPGNKTQSEIECDFLSTATIDSIPPGSTFSASAMDPFTQGFISDNRK